MLDHINGKWHQRALGMTMRVEASTKEQVWDGGGGLDARPLDSGFSFVKEFFMRSERLFRWLQFSEYAPARAWQAT